jgi:uncharacterized protein
MRLELADIHGARAVVDRTYEASQFPDAGEEYRVRGDVRLVCQVEKAEVQVRLAGRLTAMLELTCSRCLEPLPWPVDAAFDLTYLPQAQNVGEGEIEVEEDDLATAFYEGEAIDLGQLMREQFYLSLPMKPLCRPSCAGLCPECGANLNAERCGCRHEWEDPRLAVLKRWLERPGS